MRQVAEEQRESREQLRQVGRESDRQTAQVSLQPLLKRMDRFEDHLAQLGSRLHDVEDLLKSMQALLQRFITEK
jgi:predicted translin family RNA/ssDNA-binding protein